MDEIISSQLDILNINSFLQEIKKYTNESFPSLDLNNLFKNLYTGNNINLFDWTNIKNYFLSEISLNVKLMIGIMILCIIHSIFNSIIDNLDNKTSIKNVVDVITYLLISTLILNSFLLMLDVIKEAINNLTSFMKLLLPLLTTLMIATGNFATTSILEPILLIVINAISMFMNSFLIPVILVTLVVYVISNITDKIKLVKFGNFLKSGIVWILGIILTIFVSIISLEGTISSSVDGITSKTTKSAISTFVPVVGKVMGDATDTILGCCNILKNSVGFIGVIVILSIVILPMVKIFVMYSSFKFLAAISEPMVDNKLVNLIDKFSECYKLLLGILFTVSVLFIIGITLVIKITNSQMMYR